MADNIAGTKSSLTWAVHISVACWWRCGCSRPSACWCRRSAPATRSPVGWWQALSRRSRTRRFPPPHRGDEAERDGLYVIEATSSRTGRDARDQRLGHSSARSAPTAGETADLGDGETLTVPRHGDYRLTVPDRFRASAASGSSRRLRRRRISPSTTTATCCSRDGGGGHGEGVLQHADGDDPGDDHSRS